MAPGSHGSLRGVCHGANHSKKVKKQNKTGLKQDTVLLVQWNSTPFIMYW